MKKLVVFLVGLFMLLVMTATTSAAESDGYFVLTVCTANSIVVRPERVYYTEGQSVREALLTSGHEFTGLEEENFIYAIDGSVANYTFFYDGGGWNMNVPAETITAIRIGVTEVPSENQEQMLSLIRLMSDYTEMDNHVQNYPEAQEAYKICLNAARGNGSSVAVAESNLIQKMADYEAILNGPRYTVSVTAIQEGASIHEAYLTMTDSYGNVTSSIGTSIDVIAGEYTFSISDGSYNRTEGELSVSDNTGLQVVLPSGEWFGEMYMRSYTYLTGYSEPYECVQDTDNHKTTFYVDDTAEGYYGTNLVVKHGDLPDMDTTRLMIIFTSVDGREWGRDEREYRNWSDSDSTYGNFLDSLVSRGMNGCSFTIEGQFRDENGHLEIQSYDMEVIRIPTLRSLIVMADGSRLSLGNEAYTQAGNPLPVGYVTDSMDLSLITVADELDITAEPFDESYSVIGVGTVAVSDGDSEHRVVVTAPNGISSTYTIKITKTDAVPVILNVPKDVSVEVTTTTGAIVMPVNGVYQLVPGDVYTYTATKDTYYCTQASFIAEQDLVIDVATPITDNWLTSLAIYLDRVNSYESFVFNSDLHQYQCTVSDMTTGLYFRAAKEKGTVYVQYLVQNAAGTQIYGQIKKVEITSVYGAEQLTNPTIATGLLARGGYGNQLEVVVEYEDQGVKYSQLYTIDLNRTLHIEELYASAGGETLTWLDENGESIEFDRDVSEYYVLVGRDECELVLNGQYPSSFSDYEIYRGGYICTIDGNQHGSHSEIVPLEGRKTFLDEVHLPLNPDSEQEQILLEISHEDPGSINNEYKIIVRKTAPVIVEIQTVPEDTILFLTNDINGKRILPENGVYLLTAGGSYTYSATRSGYIGIKEQFTVPEEDFILSVNLEKAEDNPGLVDMYALWPQMRQNNDNNGVISYTSPTKADETVLYWAKKYGDGFSNGAISPPIMVDGNLIANCGTSLFKIDADTGEVIASGNMESASSFAINPPTYADGMIFVGLHNGTIQAFNANTLESLWVYHDPLGGQPNCSIVYQDGYIYTGFWVGECQDAHFVCLSVTDEEPGSSSEEKIATWSYTVMGGFYWAGAYVCNNYVLVGTDDGDSGYKSGYPKLVSVDTRTGAVISEVTLSVVGDIRSSITYANGKYYFTNKGGYFMEASVDGSGNIQGIRYLNLGGMSTSTPVIYNNRAYIGVCGQGQFMANSGHGICVIDISNWEIAYSATTRGYPQTSGILTTAYEAETGKVYVYFFENFTPGKLRVLEDSPGQVEPSVITLEGSNTTAYNLFEPVGEQAQFAICSPIVDENGTIYFKNDSGYLMALGSAIEELEVVQNPARMAYQEGEVFDGAGLKVVAHYANGTSKDVTKYMTWSEEPLTAEDTDFQLEYPLVMYQNVEQEDGSMLAGVEVTPPIATLSLQIESEISVKYGDVNEDGAVDLKDVNAVFRIVSGNVAATNSQKAAGDVNGDGSVDLKDLNLIFKKVSGQIAVFPVEETS